MSEDKAIDCALCDDNMMSCEIAENGGFCPKRDACIDDKWDIEILIGEEINEKY